MKMDITREIEKEEMKVRNLIKDWHPEKLEDFILDLMKKDRAEQLLIHSVVVPQGTLPMCHARKGKECIKPTSCQAFGCNKPM
tara:strand:- start:403 stop:651 length:249 start_codon:yes stop_codon:yes gene_type:complete